MFFILSKVLVFLLSPLVWITIIFLLAFLVKGVILRQRLFYSGIILLIFLSNPFVASEAFRTWEGDPQTLSSVDHYDIGIVLTGVTYTRSSAPDRVFFSKGADRILHSVQLYKAGKIKSILIAGGSGSLTKKKISEAKELRAVMLLCGVPNDVIHIEEKSRNTHESALYTKKLTDSLQVKSTMLLITSAFHIHRSLRCFRKLGMQVDGYGVDYYTGDRAIGFEDFIPDVTAIYLWEVLIHELVGVGIYKFMNYI